MDEIHDDQPGAVPVGEEAEGHVEGEGGDRGGGLQVDPGGKAAQRRLVTSWLLYLTASNLKTGLFAAYVFFSYSTSEGGRTQIIMWHLCVFQVETKKGKSVKALIRFLKNYSPVI